MKKIIHKSDTRGYANHGWLEAKHSFSFAGYYDVERVHFGALRVLNDDIVAPGRGFGRHPHDNMEIITIPLSGSLEHQDSTGGHGIIKSGEVQVMSAGTGIEHSEFNASKTEAVNLLQLWVFPNKENVAPRYDQKTFTLVEDKLTCIVSPNGDNGSLMVHQDTWFYLADFKKEVGHIYNLTNNKNGIYLFVIEGELNVEGEILNKRDAIGLTDATKISFTSMGASKFLLMELPMVW